MSKQSAGNKNRFHLESFSRFKESTGSGTFRELWLDWKWIFSYTKQFRGLIVLYTILGVALSSASLLIAYVWKLLINRVVAAEYQSLWWLVALMVAGIVGDLIVNAVYMRLSAKITVYVNNTLQATVFEKIIDARWAVASKYAGGDLLNRFNEDIKTIATNAVRWIPDMVVNLYTFTLTFILLWQMDILMALISLLAAPFLLFTSRYLIRALREQRRKLVEMDSDMMSFENDTFTNYDMIKSFGITDFYNRQLSGWHHRYTDRNLEYNKVEIKARITMTALSWLVTLVAFGYCLYRLSTGALLFGDMTFFLSQRSNVSNRFNAIVSAFPGLLNSAVSAHRIRELVELPSEQHDPHALDAFSTQDGITVELRNIAFSYNADAAVYTEGDFVARPGEIVTILGASGEGKTTLLRMILGLVSPDSGDATLSAGGKTIPVSADLRPLIAYVPQNSMTIAGTIADNMRMIKEDATDEEILHALQAAHAREFVEQLPKGIYTHLGGNAHGISVGQAQRIAIARALLRNSPILILDEATSALDVETEREVLRDILKDNPHKTCIVSTHRPGIIAQSDRLYRVENKRLKELDKEQAVAYFTAKA